MDFLIVIAAALASYIFGAIWYMALAQPWMTAAGVEADDTGRPVNTSGALPYITAFLCALLVAGMMRHVFSLSGIDTISAGFMAGLGIGLFLATPWLVTNYAFAGRSRTLMLIDGGYSTIGCTIMGIVLTLL
ncbi:DUF1761 domain-containing protein [Shimia abyssi]|uniref:Uncharacterized protein DUF1761 n=1 Tax=Shimia abyssi TaxID=1662395 RepID=A0A2P8F038_9RHOB|nr:DUF1761 domain-containing protein [Shimia abyssi]PSL15084.1 uncharacterized protein DUF1761 [Shimia abyssi]